MRLCEVLLQYLRQARGGDASSEDGYKSALMSYGKCKIMKTLDTRFESIISRRCN